MDDWASKIKHLMDEQGITQQVLADAIGVTRGQVGHYLTNRRRPSLYKLKQIAKFLSVDIKDIIDDADENNEKDEVSFIHSRKMRTVPVLDWISAGHGSYPNGTITEETEYIPVPRAKCGPNSYALIVQGDSMRSPYPGDKTFLSGDKIIVDPDKIPESGSYVIAIIDEENTQAVFKQYIEDGPKKYLKPLNSQYPVIELSPRYGKIVGTVVAHVDYNL